MLRLADSQERFRLRRRDFKIPPTTIRPQPCHKGHLLEGARAAFTTKKSAELAAEAGLGQMFVAGEPLDAMSLQVGQFNSIRAEKGLPPDQPTALLWMYCAETEEEIEEGYGYFESQLLDAKNHYFDWNSTGFEGSPATRSTRPRAPTTSTSVRRASGINGTRSPSAPRPRSSRRSSRYKKR